MMKYKVYCKEKDCIIIRSDDLDKAVEKLKKKIKVSKDLTIKKGKKTKNKMTKMLLVSDITKLEQVEKWIDEVFG